MAAMLAEPARDNADLAREFGVSREAVRQIRVAGGLPQVDARAARDAAIRRSLVRLTRFSLVEIGALHGVTYEVVRRVRAGMKTAGLKTAGRTGAR